MKFHFRSDISNASSGYETLIKITQGIWDLISVVIVGNNNIPWQLFWWVTPGPVPLGTCICSNVETIIFWTCHVYGPFEFRTSIGTSILLFDTFSTVGDRWKPLSFNMSILKYVKLLVTNARSKPCLQVLFFTLNKLSVKSRRTQW